MEDNFFSGVSDCEAILWQPVLSVSSRVTIPGTLLEIISATEIHPVYPELKNQSFKHYAITTPGFCHKKKSIALFTLALKLLSEQGVASELWLDEDKRGPGAPLSVNSQKILVSEMIQIFLQQSGFHLNRSTREEGISYEQACFLFQGPLQNQRAA